MRILVGMSGGVDSTAAALLLQQQGHEVGGLTLVLNDGQENVSAAADVRRVADQLGIPHETLDLREEFFHLVKRPFANAYKQGLTPNPCIECNRYVKFGKMLDWALAHGWEAIATGHYARIEKQNERYVLKKAADPSKDQSYVLYSLTQRQLAHAVFPLCDRRKPELRALAEQAGLLTAHKKDSQDICFVPDGDYVGILTRELDVVLREGAYLDTNGNRIGTHRGVEAYTIGQRKGLGVAFGEPRFVVSKNAAANTVTLGRSEELFATELTADDLNWISVETITEPTRVQVKTRYKQVESAATVYPPQDGTVRVVLDAPQRAVTPGQAVVFYQGDTVLGGGRIVK